jgi:uncharacterized protein DUF4382
LTMVKLSRRKIQRSRHRTASTRLRLPKKIVPVVLGLVLLASASTGVIITDYLFGAGTVNLVANAAVDPGATGPSASSITHIDIRFTKVEIHAANAGNESGWHTINFTHVADLLQTQSVSTLIGGTSLPAGKYNILRLFADHVTVTINNVQRAYHIPSGNNTGLKIPIGPGGFRLMGFGKVNVSLTFTFNEQEILAANGNITPVMKAEVVS